MLPSLDLEYLKFNLKKLNRKSLLKNVSVATVAALSSSCTQKNPSTVTKLHGKLPQVISAWPFMVAGEKWSAEQLIQKAKTLGTAGVELLDVKHWPLLKKEGLVCAATKSHTFIRGMNNKGHHAECFNKLNEAIDATSSAGFPNVMTFTGMSDTSHEKNGSKVSLEQGIKNCIEGYKKIVSKAEKKKVTLVLEPLNTRYSENMKGHPGYMGDHLDICLEIIKAVSSPSLKLLFDVYHLQIMDGNIISNIKASSDYIGHVQIAGVPGRGEIGMDQEVNYKAIMQAFYDNGYRGFVGHEWIPTKNPTTGLKEALSICDLT